MRTKCGKTGKSLLDQRMQSQDDPLALAHKVGLSSGTRDSRSRFACANGDTDEKPPSPTALTLRAMKSRSARRKSTREGIGSENVNVASWTEGIKSLGS